MRHSIIILFLLSFGIGCTSAESVCSTLSPSYLDLQRDEEHFSKALEAARASHIALHTTGGTSSATIFGRKSGKFYALTAKHVVDRPSKISVKLERTGPAIEADFERASTRYDAAIISFAADKAIPKPKLSPLNFSKLRIGTKVLHGGTHSTFFFNPSEGRIYCKRGSPGEYLTTGSVFPGNSGGPVVDFQGKLIGINTMAATCRTVIHYRSRRRGLDTCHSVFLSLRRVKGLIGPYIK